MRNIKVRIHGKNSEIVYDTFEGKQLKGLFFDVGIKSPVLPCGGMGRCGKCIVTFSSGAPSPNSYDERFLTDEQLRSGKRLLCRCVLDKDCTLELDEDSFNKERILAEEIEIDSGNNNEDKKFRYGIAVDIGTTTVAAALVGLDEGQKGCVVDTVSCANSQRRFGSDVISRIAAADSEEIAGQMQRLILGDAKELVERLEKRNNASAELMVVCGNTTMLYLLRGLPVKSLGVYPYRADKTGFDEIEIDGRRCLVLPGISAYVGADILAGIYETQMCHTGEKSLLLDLGTNGEMAYYNGSELIVASTAAGPVFEAGNISCGTASVPGAIDRVDIKLEGDAAVVSYNTIMSAEPMGLCGTGVIETVSELVKNGIVGEDGLLCDRYFEKGFPVTGDERISFTQKDIREVQLAKAAIRAGICRVVGENGIDRLMVAGGFGTHLDMGKLDHLNMLPKECLDKAEAVGNTALKGAVRFLTKVLAGGDREVAAREELDSIRRMARELVLANETEFDDAYIGAMNFIE